MILYHLQNNLNFSFNYVLIDLLIQIKYYNIHVVYNLLICLRFILCLKIYFIILTNMIYQISN